ncbi:hypothetical protein JMJ35_002146 [Cladonia borealis]|uniref:GAF domain-containing protein n=1 Tax=Cladonia borealis TaxID=184061 RepID=A0AA39R716_9LECA|nr:hypothetical protein JMJ35_002146 [Cladonia borealis]
MASDHALNPTSQSLTQDPVAAEPIDPSSAKREILHNLLQEAASFNLSNTSSLLYHAYTSLPHSSPSHHVNWAGFYTLDPTSPHTSPSLILGPFQGRTACQTIAFNRGVCGTAAAKKRTVRVHDVHEFPGHIACDERSRSEIVVPILRHWKVVAIIDIDCAEVGGFDEVDEEYLGRLSNLLSKSCDWAS